MLKKKYSFFVLPILFFMQTIHCSALPAAFHPAVLSLYEQHHALNVKIAWLEKLYHTISTGHTPQETYTQEQLDMLALELCNINKNLRIIIHMQPSVSSCNSKINETLVYSKAITLTNQGAHNLNKFLNTKLKITPDQYPIKANIYLIQDINIPHNAGENVYISNNNTDTILCGQTFFNTNSIHFLNYSTPQVYKQFDKLLVQYREFLLKRKFDQKCFCIDGSSVLAAYGIRDCHDFDFIHHGYNFLIKECPNSAILNSHNGTNLKHHIKHKDEIIFNPENHFYYKNLKFASLQIMRGMKKKRNAKKDRTDVISIDALLSKQYI